ncbi:MAG: pyridoxamine 5'-phosphate oxidase family protein [Desulfuromonadaceae bacterium]|nr:pyridoxamine 5'-phosphate oxidase family protein [Desulfuromonadaceae bacterium]
MVDMITEPVRSLMGKIPFIFVATADSSGQPHMAIGEQVTVSGDSVLIFENWFCPSTLQNIECNSRIAIVVVLPDTGKGYQMLGSVFKSAETAIHDEYNQPAKTLETPQTLTRFAVKIEQILEFTSGIHSDVPIVW